MTTRWAFVPSAPLLAVSHDRLLAPARDAARAAVGWLVDGAAEVVVLDGSASDVDGDERAGGSLRGFGLDIRAGGPREELGLAHTLGAWLLDDAGWSGPRRYTSSLADVPPALVVVADGYACVNELSPLGFDPRGPKGQAEIVGALASADPDALRVLDTESALDLGCSGAPTLAHAASAAADLDWRGTVTYDDAPLGIGYWVASWELSSVGEHPRGFDTRRPRTASRYSTTGTSIHAQPRTTTGSRLGPSVVECEGAPATERIETTLRKPDLET
ncbi:hypothetical protein JL108_12550 [Aeromicrobium sp. YIM 150415]|uniref:hypothetical protein n=1 Tax=Aeromicrobium sp. YIM 150415 TaxID=2803912 RepID=UPI00196503CC|nr:hypothetical protein [Aeromicrobium sp. YIM 150415]MBM9464283.1 hypothetical protein [Aeromicrobium sp. YIM 150415]